MKTQKYFTLLLMLFCSNIFAQTAESIRTGRPGQSIGPYTLGDRIIQLQTGYQYDNSSEDSQTINNVLRYGIGEHFEVSSVFDYRFDDNNQKGLDNLQIGARYSFTFTEQFIQAIGLQLRTRLKGSGDFQRDRESFIFLTAISFEPIDSFSYGVNLSLFNNGFDTYIQKFYAINFSYSITEKLGVFIEPYGNLNRDNHVFSVNTGLSYTVTTDLALDFSIGEDLSNSNNQFVSLGFSIRKMP